MANNLEESDENANSADGSNDATRLIRQKIDTLYTDEPDAREEILEADTIRSRSKHQQFMHNLSASGKDLATIQTEWHAYYQGLPDEDKHQVWREFYSSHSAVQHLEQEQPTPKPQKTTPKRSGKRSHKKVTDNRAPADIRAAVRGTVSGGGKLTVKHHLQSLMFGLGVGAVVMVILLFGLFNEVVLAPLYQPSRHASATPLIIDSTGTAPTDKNEVIIPKINLEIPTDFSLQTIDESVIENSLENGIVHYPTTANPGQNGNAAFFGHSSSNIFNKGKFKFAFVLLHAVTPGDTFYVTYNKKVYVYKVISRDIVDPGDVSVLDPVPGQTATATLITCDPPGTSFRRLIVVGQQISPDPATNTASTTVSSSTVSSAVAKLPGNGKTFASRLFSSGTGRVVEVITVLIIVSLFLRRFHGRNNR